MWGSPSSSRSSRIEGEEMWTCRLTYGIEVKGLIYPSTSSLSKGIVSDTSAQTSITQPSVVHPITVSSGSKTTGESPIDYDQGTGSR